MNENIISEELVREAKEDWEATMTTDDGAEKAANILRDFMQCDVNYKKVDAAVLEIESKERIELAKLETQRAIEAEKREAEAKIESARLAYEEMKAEKEHKAAMIRNVVDGAKVVVDAGKVVLGFIGTVRSITSIIDFESEGGFLRTGAMGERKGFKFW